MYSYHENTGAPAAWKEPKLPLRITRDDGNARAAENSSREIAPPFASFFAALLTMAPTYPLASASLVIDRSSLRKLMDFLTKDEGNPGWNIEPWRIEVEVVKGVLFLTKWDADPMSTFIGSRQSGFGHSFEKACLAFSSGLEESSSHHRIVEYEVAGMKWVVRYEVCVVPLSQKNVLCSIHTTNVSRKVDGYIERNANPASSPNVPQTTSFISTEPGIPLHNLEGVNVIQNGKLVPPESIIELKCAWKNSDIRLERKTLQCWLSQTPHIYCGRHNASMYYPSAI